MTLLISQLKPNPRGKDKYKNTPTIAQLLGEWVDFTNTANGTVILNGVELYHLAYSHFSKTEELVASFQGSIAAGEIVRIHSGKKEDQAQMLPEDRSGAHHHLFTERNQFIWNNAKGDCPTLRQNSYLIDSATYDAYPLEGAILIRSGAKLVPAIRRVANF